MIVLENAEQLKKFRTEMTKLFTQLYGKNKFYKRGEKHEEHSIVYHWACGNGKLAIMSYYEPHSGEALLKKVAVEFKGGGTRLEQWVEW